MADEKTSAAIAAIAARGLTHPESLTLGEIRSICASALAQAGDRRPFWKRLLRPPP